MAPIGIPIVSVLPGEMPIMLVPNCENCEMMYDCIPSPTPVKKMTQITPMAIPRDVRKLLIL
jgi:hypothetical protein